MRGCVNFVVSLIKGYKYMMKSAEKQFTEEEKEESGSVMYQISMYVGIVLGLVLAVGLFVFLPKFLVGLMPTVKSLSILRSIVEGLVKIAIFVLYMYLISLTKDIRRQYMYHGAEHKTIACHEAELPLTVENVRKQTRFHKRCGTSFIFIVLFVSIFVMCFVPFTVTWQRVVASLALLPLIVGISYECIRLAGNNDNLFTRILSAPGLAMQRITTREPDVAIAALRECIPADKADDKW